MATPPKKPDAQPETTHDTVPVVVIVDTHWHNGQPVKKGARIDVTSAEKALLLKMKAIEGDSP